MRDTKLIHFFGPDGAGKTTQVDLLIERLKTKNIRVKKIWVRSPHTFAYLLWKLFIKIGFCRVMWNPFGIGIKIPAVNHSRVLKRFWCIIELLSVLPHVMKVNFLLHRGYSLVAERYILDTITTVAFFIDDLDFIKSSLAQVLIRLIPRGTAFIFIDVDFQSVFRRRAPLFYKRQREMQDTSTRKVRHAYGYVPNSAVEPKEFIDFQRRAYKVLAESLPSLKVFSPRFSIEEISNMVSMYLGHRQ